MNTIRKDNSNSIVTGVIWQQLLIFFLPLLGGTFFQLLYNTVDTIVVGQFVGKQALSAVGGPTATLINVFVGLFVGITSGETVVVSQFYGAAKFREVREAVYTGMVIALVGGLILMAVVAGFARPMLEAMDTPEDTLELSVIYLRIYALGMVGNMVYNMGASILRGAGDSRRPFLYLAAGTLTNVVLDLLMVIVFRWGVAGAAIATIISQYVSAVCVLICLLRTNDKAGEVAKSGTAAKAGITKADVSASTEGAAERGSRAGFFCSDSEVHLDISPRRIQPEFLFRILRIGVPAALQSLMYSFSNVLIQTAIDGFGTDMVAGWTVYSKMDLIYWMVVNSFGLATTTVVGQNFGAGKFHRVRVAVREAMGILALFCVVIAGALLLFRYPFCRVFTQDEAVIRNTIHMLEFMAPIYITYITIEIMADSLRGLGDALIPTLITVIGVCGTRILWLYTALPHHRTIETVMTSYPLSWTLSSAAFFVYYEYYVRKHSIKEDVSNPTTEQ